MDGNHHPEPFFGVLRYMRDAIRKASLKGWLVNLALVICGTAVSLLIAELVARSIEPRNSITGTYGWVQHDVLGFIAKEGKAAHETHEFKAIYDVNSHGMNDAPLKDSLLPSDTKIMAVGDSHTFAIGVSQQESWPNQLERMLFKDVHQGTVYNCGQVGYSLSQYLLRFRQMKDILKPKVLIVGFSMATDLYDLIPPIRGGFIYGAEYGRVYHDLDSEGNLIEKNELMGKLITHSAEVKEERQENYSARLRNMLERSALYRRLKGSKLAMWVALHVRIKNQSLWPGMDTALKINLNDDDKYRWTLAEKIISQIALEARKDNIKVVLVNIPYLAVVYDDIWQSSFGKKPAEYDRFIASKRLREICAKSNIFFLDTTDLFLNAMKTRNEWLHFRDDKHPNVDGHTLIASGLKNFLVENKIVEPL